VQDDVAGALVADREAQTLRQALAEKDTTKH
jgi:hypothetical protein